VPAAGHVRGDKAVAAARMQTAAAMQPSGAPWNSGENQPAFYLVRFFVVPSFRISGWWFVAHVAACHIARRPHTAPCMRPRHTRMHGDRAGGSTSHGVLLGGVHSRSSYSLLFSSSVLRLCGCGRAWQLLLATS